MAGRKITVVDPKEAAIIVLVGTAIVLLLAANAQLVIRQKNMDSALQTVKSQLEQSERGIVNVPTPDYRIALVLSFSAFAAGAGIGYLLSRN